MSMTPEERAETIKEKDKATAAVVILSICMGLWAISVFIKGGYTDQPEHHAMWRVVALLPAFWGLVLLVIFRYSWTLLIASIVMSASGFYLAKAPTVSGYEMESTRPSYTNTEPTRTRNVNREEINSFDNDIDNTDNGNTSERAPESNSITDSENFSREQLVEHCLDLAHREGRSITTGLPCTQREAEKEAEANPDKYPKYR